ncbi:MAG: YggT family protein [Bacteriovoracaceae bacterium]|jgi:YggT family protein|nr:YggT family protein [Bacteriovoracaceae bacterium]
MIRFIIKIYIYIVILDAILSYFPQVKNQAWAKNIKKIADYTLNPIRKIMPNDLPFDLSPLVLILLLNFVMLIW